MGDTSILTKNVMWAVEKYIDRVNVQPSQKNIGWIKRAIHTSVQALANGIDDLQSSEQTAELGMKRRLIKNDAEHDVTRKFGKLATGPRVPFVIPDWST